MRQKKYIELGRSIKEYDNATDISIKRTMFLQCIQHINNLKDWSIKDENVKNKKNIEALFSNNILLNIVRKIANMDKHYKGNETLDNLVYIKTVNDLTIKKDKKFKNDLILTNNNEIQEYKYIEINLGGINGYEFLNQCIKEIHTIIEKIETN